MTAAEMAALHARCFSVPRPWSEAEFGALLASAHVAAVARPPGFALIRVIVDEAELLTLAVDPGDRRQGHGRALLAGAMAEAAGRGAARMFLEVADNNVAALALYRAAGFAEVGRRQGYYAAAGAAPIDALVMSRVLEAA